MKNKTKSDKPSTKAKQSAQTERLNIGFSQLKFIVTY